MNPEAIEQELAKTQVTPEASFDAFGAPPHRDAFVEAVKSAEYLGVVRDALHRSDLPFRKIEAVRVHLAKHEVPKSKGLYGAGAGYTRIDFGGSPQFHIPLGNNEVDLVSRREIADALKGMLTAPLFVINERLEELIAKWPTDSYGIRMARMTLDDGQEFEGAIAWSRHIVWVKGHDRPPFEASRVEAVQPLPQDDNRRRPG